MWTFALLQYTARFNAETVKNYLYMLNDCKIAKKKFNCKLSSSSTILITLCLSLCVCVCVPPPPPPQPPSPETKRSKNDLQGNKTFIWFARTFYLMCIFINQEHAHIIYACKGGLSFKYDNDTTKAKTLTYSYKEAM